MFPSMTTAMQDIERRQPRSLVSPAIYPEVATSVAPEYSLRTVKVGVLAMPATLLMVLMISVSGTKYQPVLPFIDSHSL